jgi:hypothetical protein
MRVRIIVADIGMLRSQVHHYLSASDSPPSVVPILPRNMGPRAFDNGSKFVQRVL